MCGIYGVVNKKVDRELAMKCLNTMIHRGPDGYGLWQEDGDIRTPQIIHFRSFQCRKPADVLR